MKVRIRSVLRIVSLLPVAVVCLATSCIEVRGISVIPLETMTVDSALARAAALTQRFGARHGLGPYTDPEQANQHYALCVARESFFLCVKAKDGEVQFRNYQAPRFTAWGDSLHRELLDSLRSMFDSARVRPCKWHVDRSPKPSGCASIR